MAGVKPANNASCYVRVHDDFQIELKTRFKVTREKKETFNLNAYFFFPHTLKMDESSYSRETVMQDLTYHARYSSPRFSFKDLMNLKNRTSPLSRIKMITSATSGSNSGQIDSLQYELRTLVNSGKAVWQRMHRKVLRNLQETDKKENSKKAVSLLKGYLKDTERFLTEYRTYIQPVNELLHAYNIGPAGDWTDEALSLQLEKYLSKIIMYTEGNGTDDAPVKIRDVCETMLFQEQQYRKERGYKSALGGDRATLEMHAYRESVLKKWAQSALYLSEEQAKTPVRIGHILAGIAAGAAMAFAVLATVLTEAYIGRSGVTWAFLVIFAYIFKDRIKDTLKSALIALMPKLIPDATYTLKDPAVKKAAGVSRMYIGYCRGHTLKQLLKDIRNRDMVTKLIPSEDIVQLESKTTLRGSFMHTHHTRLQAVDEIIRVKVNRWCRFMDDPNTKVAFAEEGKVKILRAPRVYHVHLIIEAAMEKASPQYRHYRIILTRSGIQRMEEI